MRTYDLANMLAAFDESFNILIRFLKKGQYDLALMRAEKMQEALRKCMGFLETPKSEEQKLVDSI